VIARRTTFTGTENVKAELFSDAIPLTPGKTAVSLSIPAASAGFIHVFAIALDKRGPRPLAQLFDQFGIARDAFHAEASLDWTGHALSKEALAAKGIAAGSTVHADGHLVGSGHERDVGDLVHAAGRRERPAAHGRLRRHAHVHVVDGNPLT
jgi:hypothetical protein